MPRTRSLAWSELKIGIVSLFAIAIAAVLIFLVSGEGGFFWQRYSLKTVFNDIQGLKGGAPVRVAGVEIGAVKGMNFIGDKVEVVMEVSKDQRSRITNLSTASLGSVSLLGEAAIDITANSKGTPIPEWGYVPSGAAPGSLATLQMVTARIRNGEGSLGKLLNDDALSKSVTSATNNLDAITGRINKGEGTAGKLITDEELYNRLNSMADRLDKLTASLNQGEGTAGQLLHDKQLYENINGAVTQLQDLLKEIKADPKKYLNVKVSIF